ncbi:MAG: LssY C-terminal domain-containing protein [Planctomycetaceae bacterium]
MPSATTTDQSPAKSLPPASRSRLRAIFRMLLLAGGLYGVAAYLAAPEFWRYYSRHHPALAELPVTTQTGNGTPGDPLNFALVGTRHEVVRCLVAAGWRPADPLSLKSSLEIVEASVLGKPYETAPVSNLFLWGRPQDLAFEKPVGNNPRQRHHVRFWESAKRDANGRPLWAGAAIFDRAVELSRRTGQVTHQIDGDIDRERDTLASDLGRTNRLLGQSYVDDFQPVKSGTNGGGDHWHTDGRLFLAIVAPELRSAPATHPAPQSQ